MDYSWPTSLTSPEAPVAKASNGFSGRGPSAPLSREEIELVGHYRQIPDERLREHMIVLAVSMRPLQMTKQTGTADSAWLKTKPRRRRV